MNLADLPDLCLIAILDRLPLRDLSWVCLVCSRFAAAQKAVLLRKTSLRLFGDCQIYSQTFYGDPGYRFYGIGAHDFDLVLKYDYDPELYPLELRQFPGRPHPDVITLKHDWLITEASIAALGRRFPNVKSLTIVTTNCWINSYVAKLIRNWPEVTSLTLLNHVHHGFKFGELRDSIHALTKLQKLSTDMSMEQLADLAPVIGRLSELTVHCYYAKELPAFLRQFNWTAFRRFGLKVTEIYKVDRSVLSGFFRTTYRNLTHASLTIQKVVHLQSIAANWTSLRHLELTLEPNPHKVYPKLEDLLAPLSGLSSLAHLYLSLATDHDPKLSLSNKSKLPRLEQIRRVHFNFVVDPHDIRVICAAFPAAEEILVRLEPRHLSGYQPYIEMYCAECLETAREAIRKYGDQLDSIYFVLRDCGVEKEPRIRFRWRRRPSCDNPALEECVLNFDFA